MAMQCLHLNHVTVTFLEVAEKWVYDLHASLKAELSFNVTTSSDVSLHMYASPQCLTSGGLLLSLECFPTGISDGQQIKECIVNGDK